MSSEALHIREPGPGGRAVTGAPGVLTFEGDRKAAVTGTWRVATADVPFPLVTGLRVMDFAGPAWWVVKAATVDGAHTDLTCERETK